VSAAPAPPVSAAPAVPAGSAAKPVRPVAPVPDALEQVRFLTVAEVATAMRVSKMTVYRLVHSGELPAVRVGRSFRVPEQDVHEYLRNAYIEAG
jgi:excisionase family DNA binding protein